MHLSQLKDGGVVCRDGDRARKIKGCDSVYDLALQAIEAGESLAAEVARHGLGDEVDLAALAADGALDCPIRHPDPAHMHMTGTGLTHLGSASTRDAMHAKPEAELTDSMLMFRMGIENGKPTPGVAGVQPEWFYKGSGVSAVAPGDPLISPSFALDGGEEPEIAGIYMIGQDGRPYRLGFALSNEFSDHAMEKINYLYLAHSKLRPCSFGPELRVGPFPADLKGTSKITRDGRTIWERPFLSGEENMSHSLANLEHHHFKYPLFRQPGDVHVHMFGTATLSISDGVTAEAGDVFEISAPDFGLPLKNPLAHAAPANGDAEVAVL